MKTKQFITGLALIAATAIVSAQQGNGRGCSMCNSCGKGTTYVDKNYNGVCDNAENRQTAITVKKGNGSGKCDGTGQGKRKGKNFADVNKNGVCDNYENRTKK